MVKCADKNDKNALFYVARAYDSGIGLCKIQSVDWAKACNYYKKVVRLIDEESQSVEDSGYCEASTDLCEPCYSILARMGEMHMKGGYNLDMDCSIAYNYFNEAAEKATLYGKGRLANKYYMQAEEASSMCE